MCWTAVARRSAATPDASFYLALAEAVRRAGEAVGLPMDVIAILAERTRIGSALPTCDGVRLDEFATEGPCRPPLP